MYVLKSIFIEGFWGNRELIADLNTDVNIFIGPNGSGKTTLINILQACLTLDLQMLNSLYFEKVSLILTSGSSNRTLHIRKIPTENVFDEVEYKISREKFTVPLIATDSELRRRISPRYIQHIKQLREKLSELTETSWLSVHRELLSEDYYETHVRGRRIEELLNPIDARLYKLLEKLQNYQMRLQSQANLLATDFQKSVLTSLLFNKSFDTFDLETESDINYDDLESHLVNAYNTLGALNEKTKKRINDHINILQNSVKKLIEATETGKESFHVNDVLPLSLLKRSRYLANISTKNDDKKREIFEQLELFVETLKSFLEDKKIKLSMTKEGGIEIQKDSTFINIKNLSSGEKQVFILLAETLLQERHNAIFLADEPELSLHIAWQRKLLSAIRRLNPKAQMIVATHSPEIAGSWGHRLIDMGDILK